MNYLQLCQAVRSRIGMHGSGPSTVVSPTDVEKDIVDAVYDAWIDIQNYRDEWDWMRATESFSLAAGTVNYTKTTVGGPSNRISKFIPDSLWLLKDSKYSFLRYLDYEHFDHLHKNDTENVVPYEYSFKPWDGSISITRPDSVYTVYVDYFKTPQKLAANTDTPELPERFHNLIIYLAIEKLGASIASPSQAMEYAQTYAETMGQLMRHQLPKKSVRIRGIA